MMMRLDCLSQGVPFVNTLQSVILATADSKYSIFLSGLRYGCDAATGHKEWSRWLFRNIPVVEHYRPRVFPCGKVLDVMLFTFRLGNLSLCREVSAQSGKPIG
jgi:hypothetical protein